MFALYLPIGAYSKPYFYGVLVLPYVDKFVQVNVLFKMLISLTNKLNLLASSKN